MWNHQITQVKRKHGAEMGMTFSYSGPKEKGGRPFFTVLGQKEASVTYGGLELTWVEPDAAPQVRTSEVQTPLLDLLPQSFLTFIRPWWGWGWGGVSSPSPNPKQLTPQQRVRLLRLWGDHYFRMCPHLWEVSGHRTG